MQATNFDGGVHINDPLFLILGMPLSKLIEINVSTFVETSIGVIHAG
jgi:hypothetical protein